MFNSTAEITASGRYCDYINKKMREKSIPSAVHVSQNQHDDYSGNRFVENDIPIYRHIGFTDCRYSINLIGNSGLLYSEKNDNVVAGLKKLSKFVRSEKLWSENMPENGMK